MIAFNGQLARAYFFLEDYRRSQQIAETVLEAAERMELLPIVADTLVTRGMGHAQLGRMYEGIGALEAGLRLAEQRGFLSTVLRARVNLGGALWFRDPRAALAATLPGIDLARRLGRRTDQIILLSNASYAGIRTGDWGMADQLEEILLLDLEKSDQLVALQPTLQFRAYRGTLRPESLAELEAMTEGETDSQNLADLRRARAAWALADNRLDDAWLASVDAARVSVVNGPAPLAVAGHAATWARDARRVSEALELHIATEQHGPAIELERAAMQAALLGLEGRRSQAVAAWRVVLDGWREIGCAFDFAFTAIDAAVIAGDDPDLRSALAEARAILVGLDARPFVARLETALGHGPADPAGARGADTDEAIRTDRTAVGGSTAERESTARA